MADVRLFTQSQNAPVNSELFQNYVKPVYDLIESECPKLKQKYQEANKAYINILNCSKQYPPGKDNYYPYGTNPNEQALKVFDEQIQILQEFRTNIRLYNTLVLEGQFDGFCTGYSELLEKCITGYYRERICIDATKREEFTNIGVLLSMFETNIHAANARRKQALVLEFQRTTMQFEVKQHVEPAKKKKKRFGCI